MKRRDFLRSSSLAALAVPVLARGRALPAARLECRGWEFRFDFVRAY